MGVVPASVIHQRLVDEKDLELSVASVRRCCGRRAGLRLGAGHGGRGTALVHRGGRAEDASSPGGAHTPRGVLCRRGWRPPAVADGALRAWQMEPSSCAFRSVCAGGLELPAAELARLPRFGQLVVYYQPIVDLTPGGVEGFEPWCGGLTLGLRWCAL